MAGSFTSQARDAATDGALDGKRFEGVFIARGKTGGDADTLSFEGGRFSSSACVQYGYADAPYRCASDGNALRFEALTSSPQYGKLQWTGYVRGDKLDATVMMLQDGKDPVENWVVAGLKR